MLSLGSRDGRKGLELGYGVGFDMEENELEEGEASYYHEEDTGVDPDKDFSYLDQKLHEVLGHFQKDFEGGLSADNLGAKFGGYGSFLPSYQRSPSVLSHPRSPQRMQIAASKSPNNLTLENARQSHSASGTGNHFSRLTPGSSNALSGSTMCNVENSDKRDGIGFHLATGGQSSPTQGALNKSSHPKDQKTYRSDQKTLKVRIKVANDNLLTRKNAEIYSGLGLDISPTSSPEDSPDMSCHGIQFEPDESPMTIVQIMTSFPLGGYLLSPLSDSLLCLSEKEVTFKDGKLRPVRNVSEEQPSGYVDESYLPSDIKEVGERKRKFGNRNDINSILKLDIDIEKLAGREYASNATKTSIIPGSKPVFEKTERLGNGGLAKISCREPSKSAKERFAPFDYTSEEMPETVATQCIAKNPELSSVKGMKMSSQEKAVKEKKQSNLNEVSFDQRKHGKRCDSVEVDPDGFKGKKELNNLSADNLKLFPTQKIPPLEPEGVKNSQEKEQLSGSKKKVKRSLSNGDLASLKGPKSLSCVATKEKKSSHQTEKFPDTKSDHMGNCKESIKIVARESHRDSFEDFKHELFETDGVPMEANLRVKSKDTKVDIEKENPLMVDKVKERSGGRKVENGPIHDLYPKDPSALMNGTLSDAGLAPVGAPVVVKENWVCCDLCQTWRLLPYHVNPDNLPKKWLCSLMDWLPGMNKCSFSEEETSRALRASYAIPPVQDGTSCITSAGLNPQGQMSHLSSHTIPNGGKKKHAGSKDLLNPANNTSFSHPSSSMKKNLHTSVKSISLNDVNQSTLDSNMPSRSSFQLSSKQSDLTMEKIGYRKKEKHKSVDCYSGGGDYVEQNGKPVSRKTSREAEKDPDSDSFRSSKNFKREGSHYSVDDLHSDPELRGNAASSLSNGLQVKLGGKAQKQQSYSSSKESKGDVKNGQLSLAKKLKVNDHDPIKYKAQVSVSEVSKSDKSDLSAKKRKLKAWQESEVASPAKGSHHSAGVSVKEEISEREHRKEKKAKVSKFDGRECSTGKADSRTDKKGRVTKIFLSANRDSVADTMGAQKHNLDGIESLSRDLGYKTESSAAATSSSSKVSGSRKSKNNFQEVRGSPVESVSSSPMRISNFEKLNNNIKRIVRGKDEAINGGLSDGEDGGFDDSGKATKAPSVILNNSSLESNRVGESLTLDRVQGFCNGYQDSGDVNQNSMEKSKGPKLPKALCVTISNKAGNIRSVNGEGPIDALDMVNLYPTDAQRKGHDNSLDGSHSHANGFSQGKPIKNSSRSKERHKTDKDKKVSTALSEQGGLREGAGSFQYEAESHDQYSYLQNQREGKSGTKSERDDENCVGRKDSTVKILGESRSSMHSKHRIPESSDVHCSPRGNKRQTELSLKSRKGNGQMNLPYATSHEEERSVSRNLQERSVQAEAVLGRGKSLPPDEKQENQVEALRPELALNKGCRSDALPGDASSVDTSKLPKQSRKLDNQNGVNKRNLRYPICNGSAGREADASKDSSQLPSNAFKDQRHAAESAMREAKDLKHTADRVKNAGGQIPESTGLYFEAALKFLHGASLLEPICVESAKHGEITQSMQVYSDTAKLCEFCAHEYERQKDLASASLAYKCMEVAYMRVIYSKNSSACKDRRELQSALQMVPPGESPSSSASDVDNLNNHGTVDKAAIAKCANSPQIAGNHVIIARNRPNFVRLLNFAQDMNSAMEALLKSQNAFALANANEDARYGPEGISSVKKVLDFNIHDVEGILRLIRVAMESIGH